MEAYEVMTNFRRLALSVSLPLLGACAPPQTLYSWGHYEEVLYSSSVNPGQMPPEKQIETLEKDYQFARSKNQPVPPGWHAHLGYLYYQVGKLDQAKQEFVTEKSTFPESAVFMDRLLARFKTS